MKNFIHTGLLTRDEIVMVLIEALRMIPHYCKRCQPPLTPSMRMLKQKKQLAPKLVPWFEEMSTRTRGSFEEAAELVGLRVGSPITPTNSSLGKHEAAAQTLRMLIQQGADMVVIRSKTEGLGLHLAQCIQKTASEEGWVRSNISIMVGGAGTRDHPSQVLLDLLTIVAYRLGIRKLGQFTEIEEWFKPKNAEQRLAERIIEIIESIRIAFVGDLVNSRVVHDWIKLAHKAFKKIAFRFIAPAVFQVEQTLRASLDCAADDQLDTARGMDIIYTIRGQMERWEKLMSKLEADKILGSIQITPKFIESYDGVLMDAQPIDKDAPMILPELWHHPQNLMMMQSAFGIPTRMALLRLCETGRQAEVTPLLEEPRVRPNVLQEGDLAAQKKKLDARYASQEDSLGKYVHNGTVIDRLAPGTGLLVRRLCEKVGLLHDHKRKVLIEDGDTHLPLPGGKKDIIQLHDVWPTHQFAATIGLISPTVRFSFMRVGDEKEYRRLEFPLPKAVAGLFSCPNQDCITNCDPEVQTFFEVSRLSETGEVAMECAFCQRVFPAERIIAKL